MIYSPRFLIMTSKEIKLIYSLIFIVFFGIASADVSEAVAILYFPDSYNFSFGANNSQFFHLFSKCWVATSNWSDFFHNSYLGINFS